MNNYLENKLSEELKCILKAFFPWNKSLAHDYKMHYRVIAYKIENSSQCLPLKYEFYKIPSYLLESLEYYLRLKYPNNELTKKIHALSYLIETKKESFDEYFLVKNNRLNSWIKISLLPFEMLTKITIGFIVCKRYNIV